ncbi:MAG: DNA mismatch repair endonuclease MutL [Armatimonadota bacterium]
MAGSIVILDDNVANKIAAGEVVERPASVVKELIENSIDAAATRITIDLVEGGKRLVRVTDDGTGMSDEDAVLCLQRHATSKISSAEDLDAITTLGFRGEALPSIASVSQFTLLTRLHDSAEGTRVVVEGGEFKDCGPVGCPPGTTVEARNLFFNTPARLKFLRSSATERGRATEVVSRAALGHPEIGFRMTHNDGVVFSTPPGGDLFSVMSVVYGKNAARELIPVELESAALRIYGYVSTPNLSRVNRAHQTFFVNRRPVRSRVLSHAVSQPYQSLLPAGRQPVVVIHIEIDPRLMDPNVHPTKTEVRFSREWEVHNLVQQAVERALASPPEIRGRGAIPGTSSPPARPHQHLLSDERERRFARAAGGRGGASAARSEWEPRTDADLETFREELRRRAGLSADEASGAGPTRADAAVIPGASASAVPSEDVRAIGQLAQTYILAEADGRLFVIDQHVAAERAEFERLAKAADESRARAQGLLTPVSLEMTQREAAVVEENLETLRSVGFDVEAFGPNAYLVRAIPETLVGHNYEAVLRDAIQELAMSGLPQSVDARRREVLTALACHSSVKAGEPLSREEMTRLLRDWLATQTPHMCPHGRPIVFSISLDELARRFGR